MVLGRVKAFGGVQQSFGRDAADVEAGAAELLALLNTSDLHAELGAANRGHVTAGSGAYNNHIVGGWSSHEFHPQVFELI